MLGKIVSAVKRVASKTVAVATGLFGLVSTSIAAPPDLTAVQTVFTDAQTAAETLFGYALPVVGGIMILFIVLRLTKRFGRQAS